MADRPLKIWAGTLDAPTGVRLAGHIHVADKGDYYEIVEGLPQFRRREPWPGTAEDA